MNPEQHPVPNGVRLHHPVQAVDEEVHRLHEIEQAGESPATPFIALLGVFLVVLAPVFLLLVAIGFSAYHLAT